jgi:cell wall-associated NlpC family hydrolase
MRLTVGIFAVTVVLVSAACLFVLFGGAALLEVASPSPSASALSGIPPSMLALYQQAAATCPGLPWTVLAGIGTVESSNGTSDLPGVHSGANYAGAEGPMQFEPATFAQYDEPVPPGGADPPSPYDPVDAVYAAARLLCANGAKDGSDLPGAVFTYNHDSTYVTQVLDLADSYGLSGTEGPEPSSVGTVAADWALAQVGTPYVWGGETVGVGFDCSGLVQAAYQAAGVDLPRVAQDQYDATSKLDPGDSLAPGDLVFFGAGTNDVTHVGIYVGSQDGQAFMVDAPYTGADVRVEPFPTTVGAPFGPDVYVGATRPGI